MTCSLALALGNSGKLVTVEADPDVWGVLQVGLFVSKHLSFLVSNN